MSEERVVYTDLSKGAVDDITLTIFTYWVEFALGQRSLGGKRLKDPSGRYASSIRLEEAGPYAVAVIADSTVAPEADIIETGHGAIDMKQHLEKGRAYPMHRPHGLRLHSEGSDWVIPPMPAYNPTHHLERLAAQLARKKKMASPKFQTVNFRPSMWTVKRDDQFTGFASTPH